MGTGTPDLKIETRLIGEGFECDGGRKKAKINTQELCVFIITDKEKSSREEVKTIKRELNRRHIKVSV